MTIDEEVLDYAAREEIAERWKTHGPRTLAQYASQEIMDAQLLSARRIIVAYFNKSGVTTYDELGRIADSRKVIIEGLEADNSRLDKIAKDLSLWASTTSKHLPEDKQRLIAEYLTKHKLTNILR